MSMTTVSGSGASAGGRPAAGAAARATGRLQVARRYTRAGSDPYETVRWVRRDARIEGGGAVVFEARELEVPEGWSQNALNVVASKYLRKAGAATLPGGRETSVRQLVGRVARTLSAEGLRAGYFASPEDADAFHDELVFILLHQMASFNSPVWFNLGLWHEYGIMGSGGNWAWNEALGRSVRTDNAYERPQCGACFIQSVEDSLESIYELVSNEARLFKHGSGTGSNFSALRAKTEKLSGGGTSSGVMSFLEVFDRAAGSTKSGGTTRRAAKMVVLDVDHPEIVDFIEWKRREERKARVLIEAGYEANFNGEAYRTVGGQNSNNSVRVTDAFLRAARENGEWNTVERTTGQVAQTHSAQDLWDRIARAAWECADPGVHFADTINDWHTCPNSGEIQASNPCSEYVFLNDTSCNLASLNLAKFAGDAVEWFDVASFRHAARVVFLAQEILVDLCSYPTERIANNSHNYRPLGLGYANLGALLMTRGIPYDSDRGRAIAACLTAVMTGEAYARSAEMAEAVGPFPGFAANRDPMLRVIRKHQQAAAEIGDAGPDAQYLKSAAREAWTRALALGEEHGYRNAQATLLAPTGTIGFMMDCDTTGIEPDYALVKYKELAGRGSMEIENQSVPAALAHLGYGAAAREAILAHLRATGMMEGAPGLRAEHLAVFDCASPCGKGGARGTRYLAPMAHVEMMAAVQPFLSGAISKTVNLPSDATVEDVKAVYDWAWQRGLKCVALYRDGCKASQPLNTSKPASAAPADPAAQLESALRALPEARALEVIRRAAPRLLQPRRERLPKRRLGFTQEVEVGGHKVFFRASNYPDGRLGEIFVDLHKQGAAMRSLYGCFSQAVSLGLQHGVPLEKFVNMFTFTNFEPNGLVVGHDRVKSAQSIVDYLFRALAVEYLGRDELAHVPAPEASPEPREPSLLPPASASAPPTLGQDCPPCPNCHSLRTVRNGACFKCTNCGESLGCS
jgi:ribonucleoside-diphosphate reductase alpha chain